MLPARRILGDLLRAAANQIDPPSPLRLDARKIAASVADIIPRVPVPVPARHGRIDRTLGRIFGW